MPNYTISAEIGEYDMPVNIEFDYTPGDPGKSYGDPETCYPPEGPTFEVCGVFLWPSNKHTDISDFESWGKQIEELCLDHVASIGEA